MRIEIPEARGMLGEERSPKLIHDFRFVARMIKANPLISCAHVPP